MLHRALENNTVTHKGDKTAIGAALHALNVSSFWGMLQPDKMGQNPSKMIGVVQVKEYDQPAALVGPVMAATHDWTFDTQLEYPYEAWAREPPPPQAPSPGLMVHITPRNTTQPERRGRVLRLFMSPPAQEQLEALASKIWLQLVGMAAVVACLCGCCVTKYVKYVTTQNFREDRRGGQPSPCILTIACFVRSAVRDASLSLCSLQCMCHERLCAMCRIRLRTVSARDDIAAF